MKKPTGKEPTEAEIVKKLVCTDIPDTRALRQARIDSVGTESCYEKIIREHYPELYEEKRLVRLPDAALRKVYQLSFPLSFPICDFSTNYCGSTCFFRWASGSSDGGMNITTPAGLDQILRICDEQKLPFEEAQAYGTVCELEKPGQGAAVPLSWRVDTYDPARFLFEAQFVQRNDAIYMISYVAFTNGEETETTRESPLVGQYTIRTKRESWDTYRASAAAFCQKHLEEGIDWIKKNKGKLLKAEQPVVIFDPAWVDAR